MLNCTKFGVGPTCFVLGPCLSVATSSSRPSCLTANSSALVSASSAFLSASFSSSPVRRFSSFISTIVRENFSCRERGIEPLY